MLTGVATIGGSHANRRLPLVGSPCRNLAGAWLRAGSGWSPLQAALAAVGRPYRWLSCGTAYCQLRSLVEHSYINSKSLAVGYLDEKPIDTGLVKFLGLCPSALPWYLEFASAFFTSMRARDR
ncbi:hypothetical protein B296_00047768 [Ensete ventricosum]|uniref:Uncharacterized protein n=1 Tax=Ensete ventricosum TaxID=4639 RepID=A0A426XDF0_ENSVE|nr:hypothetical protein B296_00047768 [Ensete ventricosum]